MALPDPKQLGSSGQPLAANCVLPRNSMETTIAHIWQDLLKVDHVSIHDNFFDLGGHSLLAVRVLTRIERAFDVRLPLTSFLHSATIAQLAELVDSREDEACSWSPLVAIQTKGTKTPFFGIHPVGGGVLFWKDIVKYMPNDQPFYAIQAQGVDGMRPALHRIEDMAGLYITEIRKVQPHGPYYLGGYSLGGEIAFEMAQQLSRAGEKVDLLVLFDTRNPVRAIRPVRVDGNTVLPVLDAQLPASGYELLKIKVGGHYWRIRQFKPLKAIKYVAKLIIFHTKYVIISFIAQLFRVLQKRLPDGLLLQYLRTTYAMALRNYVPTIYQGKVTLFHASESKKTNPIDSPMGWGPLANGGLDVHYFDTPHTMIQPEYAEQIARKLNECLLSAGIE
ncbi:MAG: thioesterase domain-containing protein [Anaerolineales bacterium]